MTPTPKVAAAGIAGAVSVILVWLLNTVAGVDVPPEVAAAFTTVLAFGAGYLKAPAGDNGNVTLIELVIIATAVGVALLCLGWVPR